MACGHPGAIHAGRRAAAAARGANEAQGNDCGNRGSAQEGGAAPRARRAHRHEVGVGPKSSFLRSIWECLHLRGYTEPLPAAMKRTDSLELMHKRINSRKAKLQATIPMVQ